LGGGRHILMQVSPKVDRCVPQTQHVNLSIVRQYSPRLLALCGRVLQVSNPASPPQNPLSPENPLSPLKTPLFPLKPRFSSSQEAGGVVTDMRGAPLDFSHGAKLVKNRGVVASASKDLHDKVLLLLLLYYSRA